MRKEFLNSNLVDFQNLARKGKVEIHLNLFFALRAKKLKKGHIYKYAIIVPLFKKGVKMRRKLTQKELTEFSKGIQKIVKANCKMLDDYRKNKHKIDGDSNENRGVRR